MAEASTATRASTSGNGNTAGPRRYAAEEAHQVVDQVWQTALDDAIKRVWAHPFTQELDAGTLPIEVIKGFVANWFTAAQEINAGSASNIYVSRDFYARFPDLEEMRADATADEFSAPGPGGHQRTITIVAKALGWSYDELINYPLIPEARAYLDNLVGFFEGSGRGVGVNINEERLAEWFRVWCRSLVQHYGLTEEDIFYFTMHAEADARGEHFGGPIIGEEVMGHADGNRLLAQRTLEEGLGPLDPMRTWVEIAKAGTDMFLLLLDGCYKRYYPKRAA